MAKMRRSEHKSKNQERVEDLLVILLLAIGIEARTIAKVLGVVPSAISNKFPVTEIRKQSKLLR
jgi:phage terminase Nu1 subunit (DNA packaging protein)